MAIPHARKILTASTIALIASCAGFAPISVAQPAPPRTAPTAAGDDEMPFAIETFQYPDGAKISQEKGIVLGKGDGRILLTDCAAYDIKIDSLVGQKDFCFSVKGRQGYLAVEIADAFGIWTKDHPVKATIRSDGKDSSIDVAKNEFQPFGQAGKTRQRALLLELRVTG
ncbi:hypothetical protein [Streptomyces aureoversilis]|uniref:Secreted protein n=1 Tax=Streptomyces aureoversilis TaxID=67277 RepID=A0ABV9ZXB7_9ACTN